MNVHNVDTLRLPAIQGYGHGDDIIIEPNL